MSVEKFLLNPMIMIDCGIILVKDIKHRFIASNVVFSRLAGKKTESLIGLNDFDMPWAESASIYVNHEKDILRGDNYSVVEPLNGTAPVNLITTKKVIYDAAGKPAGTIATAVEITQNINFFNLAGKSESIKVCNYGEKYNLTRIESKVMYFLLKGLKRAVISESAGISLKSVDFHLTNLKKKFKADSTTELVILAYQKGYQDILPFTIKF
ncbi:helix-turn-helix transcriptional regulator [Serratia marcescens]|uniref:Helix-turn-helix transcriptional regulator n=1 Tax=Serratia marcescens TaxID=615 RepID=A0A5C7BS04_SERMA|nr:PAS and helix-turn-helix domain-containing protein [Serratia marcescens]TXE26760.1 helix-turn-helix transcriptional regulator [Serratia marcescens]TXE55025.1 helix-turn-helix transcriptional regulator [Serratia marcescens]